MTRHPRRTPKLAAAMLLGAIAVTSTGWRSMAAGTISGVVFEDFNGNGLRDTTTTVPNAGAGSVSAAIDRGVGGVTVTVYDAAGVVQGTTTSAAANGSYSIAATGTGPYRVEFTGLPAGYYPSRFAAGPTGNGTTIQFVPDGDTADVNLAILDPANFCQNNPTFVTACYVFGQFNGPNAASPVVVDFPYSAGATGNQINAYFQPAAHALMVPQQSVGTVYGMAYRPDTNTVYAGAYMKKHAGFGPGGTGAIYAIDPTTGASSIFADLNAIAGTGPDLHDPADYNRDNGNLTWDAVGKVGLGGLEVSPNGQFLYAVNLFDRRVWELPTGGGAPRSVAIPVPATAVPASGADLRPFALQYFRGRLYLGMVNSAETTQNAADLRAYVYALDPVTLTFASAPLLDVSLQYPRGQIQLFSFPGSPGAWLPWSPVYANNWTGNPALSQSRPGTYPQPMLSSLAFDVDGNLTIGIRDRAGDQFGYFAFDNPNDNFLWQGVAGGDTLLAELNVQGDLNSGWTLESNARTTSFGPTAGAGNNQGPGGGEYFFQDDFNDFFSGAPVHQETHGGAVLQLPGFPDVVVSSMNPGLSTDSGGAVWVSRLPGATEGTKTKGYNLYASPATPGAFGKAAGFGEFVAICQAAPIEIGNRIWDDIDGDGVQDANEPGLDGVTVQLIGPGGGVLATTVTANGGQYYFSSTTTAGLTPNTAGFIVRVGVGQASLGGRSLTGSNTDATPNGDSRDSDAGLVGGNAEIPVTTGGPGQNNHTYDIGFTQVVPLSLGNYVWYDTNDNGIVDAGEQPIDGVDVVLFRDNGDGVFNALTDTVLASQTTVGGLYLFTNLTPGNYFVQIPATEFAPGQTLVGYRNSTPQFTGDLNDRDHGAPAPVAGQGIVSDLVTLTNFGEPINDGDADPNSNLTIDFGFYRLTLGNLVFFDPNNNGVFDTGDTPASGVPVELLNGAGSVIQTAVTDALGIYGFTDLAPGNYAVRITPPANYTSSTGAANAFEPGPDPDNDVDNDDNGTNTGGTITSAQVTLTAGAEPIVTNATGTSSNPTVDFGLIASQLMSLGNLVWRDTNNDGLVSPGEPGIDGVTVRLFDGTGTVQLNQMQTGGGGFYLFTNLQPGNYVVEVVTPAGLLSSTGAGTAYEPAPDPDNDVNDDDNGTTQGAVVRSLPVTLAFNTEPTNDGDGNDNSNLSVDFGFYPQVNSLCLGNLVWFDANDNGVVDGGEVGVPGVTLRLIGADGVTVIATTVTDANGNYLFCGLAEGIYYVEVDRTNSPISGLQSSTDIGSSANPDNDTDNDDNGVNVTPTTVRSNAVTLVLNTEPTNDGDNDPNTNLTIDFGFIPNPGLVSLGNLVWWDSNNNGVADRGEIGLQGVTVRLIAANGTTVLATTTTNVSGNYLFGGLQPGTYIVEVAAPTVGVAQFARPSSTGTGLATPRPPTGPNEPAPDPDNDLDNDDNGTMQGAGIVRSLPVTLTAGTEPTAEDNDPNSNLTVDFGFVPGESAAPPICGLTQAQIPNFVVPNVPFTARYVAENGGPGWAYEVIIDGMLEPGVTVVSMAPSAGGVCTTSPGMVDCRWAGATPVGPAGARSVDITLTADARFVNKPVWLWFMGAMKDQQGNSEACQPVDGYPFVLADTAAVADLALTAQASSAFQTGTAITAPANQPMTTRFSVTNGGAVPARGAYALLLDGQMPLDVTNASLTQGTVASTGATSGVWDTGDIAPGGSASLTVTLVPRSGTTTKFDVIRTNGFPADPNVQNDFTALVIDGVAGGGGRRVAVGNFDGAPGDEIATASGPGEGQVRLFTGGGAAVWNFFPFQRTFTGGVRVASCDVNGDGASDLVMGQGAGGGQVRVVSLVGNVVSDLVTFDAFEPTFTGGVNVACADVDRDGRGEVVVAPDGGRAPDVRVFDVDIELAQLAQQFQAYEPTFTGGVRVAAADFAGSPVLGAFQIVTMPGPGRAGDVRVWATSGGAATLVAGATVLPPTGARLALGDANGDGGLDLLLMPDGGTPALMSIFSLQSGALLFTAPQGAAGIQSLDAAVGRLTGGPGVEVVIGRGPGESPEIISFTIGANGVVVPRLVFTAIEVP